MMTDTTKFTIPEIMIEMNLGIVNRNIITRNKIPELMNDHRRKNACVTRNLGAKTHDAMTMPSHGLLE